MTKNYCVFCGSSMGKREIYREAARALGAEMAQRGIGLVYGGGGVGLMGELADAVIDAGGDAIGIIPAHLVAKEVQHKRIQDLRVVQTMHERKAMMADLASGFIALPGGYGTYDEFCEVVTWTQLGLHKKPCALLNVGGFYDPLLAMFDHATDEGFIRPDHRSMLIVSTDARELLEQMQAYRAPLIDKWITQKDV